MKKFYCIELLRFFTSLAVVIRHYHFFFYPRSSLSTVHILTDTSIQPYYPLLGILFEKGDYAVPIFWAISGFVFALVYLEREKDVTGKIFFINRFARLYPLHFATLILVALIQIINISVFDRFQIVLINDIYRFVLHLFFISGWEQQFFTTYQGYSFNYPIWSVSIEILIYALFFVSIVYIKKYELKYVIGVYIIAFIIDKLLYSSLFIDCFRLFFSGIIVYYINIKTKRKFLLFIFSLFLLLISFIGNFKIFLFAPGLLLFFVYLETFNMSKLNKIFGFLGSLTYSLYLLHIPTMLLIILLFYFLNISYEIFLLNQFFIVYLIFIIFISYISYRFFEKPTNKIIRSKFN